MPLAATAARAVAASKIYGSGDAEVRALDAIDVEFAQGADPRNPNPSKYKEAIEDYKKYLSKYPDGKFAEECMYRIPLCSFQLGDYAKALEGFLAFGHYLRVDFSLCNKIVKIGVLIYLSCLVWVGRKNGSARG